MKVTDRVYIALGHVELNKHIGYGFVDGLSFLNIIWFCDWDTTRVL